MDDPDGDELRRRLREVEERLDRVATRLTLGYGSDADRDAWLVWLRQLSARRDELLTRLEAHDSGPAGPTRDAAP